MRTHTSTSQRVAVVMSGAIAALVIGGATAPAAFAGPGDKTPANHGKKVGHSKKAAKAGHARKADRSQGSNASADSNRASSNKVGSAHNDDWQAQSDPDGLETGGIDQPGGNGGYDPKGWDGNNGSGNDPDCEDDNRGKGVPGHCKDRPAQRAQAERFSAARMSTSQPSDAFTVAGWPMALRWEQSFAVTRAGGSVTRAGVSTVGAETSTEVVGVTQLAGRAPGALAAPAALAAATSPDAVDTIEGTLPETGADAAMLVLLAGGLAAVGAGAVLVRRSRVTQN